MLRGVLFGPPNGVLCNALQAVRSWTGLPGWRAGGLWLRRGMSSSSPPWHPGNLAARLPFLRRRAALTAATRSFFATRGYLEVETPYAVPVPGEEVHLRPFATRREHPDGRVEPLWLHTSPE